MLSPYVKVIRDASLEGEVALFNSYNNLIIMVNEDELAILTSSEYHQYSNFDWLYQNNFFISKEYIHNEFSSFESSSIKKFSVEINLTEDCNLNCSYCYQNEFSCRNVISDDTISNIMKYIESVLKSNPMDQLSIYFFGGEPTLYRKKILEIKRYLDDISMKYDVNIIYSIGTNGILLTEDFVSNFEQLHVDLALTAPADHNKFRSFRNGRGTFDLILKNLTSWYDEYNPSKTLSIRYNTNGENIQDFEELVTILKEANIRCEIDPAYIDNYEYNDYSNILSREDYMSWVSTTFIDILIKHGFPLYLTHYAGITLPCKAYEPFSCKFFSDGTIALCDATNYFDRKKIPFKEIISNPNLINEMFSQYKLQKNKDNPDCLNCSLIMLCKGRIYCNQTGCKDNFIYDVNKFIANYLNHVRLGNQHLFKVF